MKNSDFNQIVSEGLEKTKATLISKADEYARGDRLSNFKQMSALLRVSPEKALFSLVSKHIVAISDFVNDIEFSDKVQSYERWNEKIGDIIAYMTLLDAMIMERLGDAPRS